MTRSGAFFLAPVPAALFGAAVSSASGAAPRPWVLFLGYLLILYAAQLLFGLPIRALLLRAGRTTAAAFTLGGIVMIALPVVPYLIWAVDRHPHQLRSVPFVLILFLTCGALTGLIAWHLMRKPGAVGGEG